MTNWRPASELTREIIEAAWRLIVWDGEDAYLFLDNLSDDGFELHVFDGKWHSYATRLAEGYPVTHFAVIDAPPEEANT